MCELAKKKNVQRQLLPCTWNKDKTNVWTLTARIYKISLNFSKSFSLWGLTWLSLHVFIPGRPWFNIHYGFFSFSKHLSNLRFVCWWCEGLLDSTFSPSFYVLQPCLSTNYTQHWLLFYQQPEEKKTTTTKR